ncbi:hypothetical protein FOZ61_008413 [Perkinsus olseni]|uniref:RRM domain-containing protein n=1 Tax=Perkinsus olseni TaxID=32597 RepID=A0A7J6L4R5_PEROL|nr:hypothetical protein FOZ61_008413 [Perkinsus olseni]KAF4661970.1 hypothetical protein FOL46_005512 [Perkinsus olseni]
MSAFSRPDDQRQQQQQPPAFHSSLAYGNAEDRKIFMGGLPQEIDKQYIDAYFSQFGAIEDSIVMIDRATGRSRGFGFITFLQPQDMEACLANGPHVVMEKVIDVKRAADGKKQHTPANAGPVSRGRGMTISRPDPDRYGHFHRQSVMDDHPGQVVADDPRKVFIGGIPVSGDRDKLIALLSRYGNVIDCDIMYDKETGRNKGFGRATFSSPEEAAAAMRGGERNMIDAKCVDIKPLLRPSDSHNNSAHGSHHQRDYQRRDSFTSDPADASCKLFLGGIPQSADEDKLAHHLSRYGRVVDVRIYQDLETGRHKGFGYAVMGTPMEAQAACNGGNNNYIDAKWVQIKPFCSPTPHDRYPRNPQQQHTPTPPPPAGGAPPPPPPPPSSVNATGLPVGRPAQSLPPPRQQSAQPYQQQQPQQSQTPPSSTGGNTMIMSMQDYHNPYIRHQQQQQDSRTSPSSIQQTATPTSYPQQQQAMFTTLPAQGTVAGTYPPAMYPINPSAMTAGPARPSAITPTAAVGPAMTSPGTSPGGYAYRGFVGNTTSQPSIYNPMSAYQRPTHYVTGTHRTMPY